MRKQLIRKQKKLKVNLKKIKTAEETIEIKQKAFDSIIINLKLVFFFKFDFKIDTIIDILKHITLES